MTDNIAVLEGYTMERVAIFPSEDIAILVKPSTDFSGMFCAWHMEKQELVWIDGKKCRVEIG